MSKKPVVNKYRQVPVDRPPDPKKAHPNRINIKEGDIVDPSRYNASFNRRFIILEPARVLDVKHDDDNPYYTQVLLASDKDFVWLGQSWLEWEGKRKA